MSNVLTQYVNCVRNKLEEQMKIHIAEVESGGNSGIPIKATRIQQLDLVHIIYYWNLWKFLLVIER